MLLSASPLDADPSQPDSDAPPTVTIADAFTPPRLNAAPTLTMVWNGDGDGVNWSDPANWDLDIVPSTVDSSVIIPNGFTVTYDLIDAPHAVASMVMGSGSGTATLNFAAGADTQLTVGDPMTNSDLSWAVINVNGGKFIVDGNDTTGDVNIDNARISASNGAMVQIDAGSYASTGLWADNDILNPNSRTWSLMTATGAGTVLDLSSVVSIDAGFNSSGSDADIQQIQVSDGAEIDLSGLTDIVAPNDIQDRLDIIANGADSQLRLDELTTATSASSGPVRFVAQNDTTLSMPKLQTMQQVRFDVSGGSELSVGGANATYSSLQFVGGQ